MNRVIVLIGVAGSGKSTYANKVIRKEPKTRYISADEIRFQLLDSKNTKIYFDQSIETKVWDMVFSQYSEALIHPNDIIFDATNVTLERRYRIVALARDKKKTLSVEKAIEFVFFNIPLMEILKRNKSRERIVEDSVIAKQYSQIQKPELWEYDKLTIITENTQAEIDIGKVYIKIGIGADK